MAVPAYEALTCFLAQTMMVRPKPPTMIVSGMKGVAVAILVVVWIGGLVGSRR